MSKKTNTIETPTTTTTNEVTPIVTRSYLQLIETYKSKSGVIRGLHSEGQDTKGIYKTLKDLGVTNTKGDHPIRYQHVRNVLNTPIKKV